jgi:hypothetical protein
MNSSMRQGYLKSAVVMFVVVAWFAASNARAATITWTNAAFNGYYTNASLWQGFAVPGANDDARLSTAAAVVIDGGSKSNNLLEVRTSGASFILNMDSDATMWAGFDASGGSTGVIVSNGTLVARSSPVIGGSFGRRGNFILSGGNYLQTNANGAIFTTEAGVGGPTLVRVDAGSTFTFASGVNGAFNLGSSVIAGRGGMQFQVNGGTVNVTGGDGINAVVGRWAGIDSVAAMTSVLTVASGTLSTFTNASALPTQRLVVGGRGNSFSTSNNSDFDQHVAQLIVSNAGTLNAGAGGVAVGRNANGSGGEFVIHGGNANVNGLIVGDLGKLTQTNGILKFNAKYQFLNEATDNAQHLFMSGGTALFQGISSNQMTINMGGASAGNVLGQGFYNVQFGSNGGSAFTINLTNNAFYGRGTATGGNGIFGDGIMDLVIWTNTSVIYNSTTYSGTSGPNSLLDFATLATPWGWDVSVGAIPEPAALGLVALGGLFAVALRRRREE